MDKRSGLGASNRHPSISFPPLRQLGLALWWAWAYVTFYSQALLPTGEPMLTGPRDTWISSCFGYVITMIVAILTSKRSGSIVVSKFLCIVSPISTCLGTGLLSVAYCFGYASFWMLANVAGFVTGFGTALLSLAWGELFGALGMEETGRLVTTSLFMGIALNMVIIGLPLAVRVLIAVALPMVSMAMLRASVVSGDMSVQHHGMPSEYNARPLPAKLIVNIGAIAITFGYLRGVGLTGEEPGGSPYVLFSGIAAVALCLSLYTNLLRRPLNVGRIYRCTMVILIASFMSIPYLMNSGFSWVAAAAVTACYDCFDMVVWAIMANVAALASASTVATFAWGRLSNHVGMLLGVGLGLLVNAYPGAGGIHQSLATTGVVFILVLCIFASTREVTFFTTPPTFVSKMSMSDGSVVQACKTIAHDYGLTPREEEVLGLLSKGRNASYVAEALVISDNTAKTHAKHIYKKLGINTQQQLMDLVESYSRGL